jgi:amino acid transporter
MTTYNGTGAPAGWNWCLSYLATAGILIGFDASGHVAEETKNASVNAAKGIFWSTVVSGVLGFSAVILFLFTAVSFDIGSFWMGILRTDMIFRIAPD